MLPALVAASVTLAQEADEDRQPAIEEILVTAQKFEQREQDVPISLKTIGSDLIERINAERFEDIGRLVPSLSFTDRQRGQNQVLIRGLGTVNGVSTVAIYNDGVIAATRVSNNGSFGEQDPTFYDVERVEVLRGPQGTLYGEGSFGGVINIVSNKPDPSAFDASVSGTWSDVKEGTSDNFGYAGMLNVPLVSDRLALRLVGSRVDQDGYVEQVDTLTSETRENINTEETTSARAVLGYAGGGGFEADLIYRYQDIDLGGSNSVMPATAEAAGIGDEYTQFAAGDTRNTSETSELVLDMNWDLGFGVLTSLSGLTDVELVNRVTIPGFDIAPLFNVYDAWSQELRLASTNGQRFDWVVGAYLRDATREVETVGIALDVDQQSYSLFGQLYWYLSEAVTATVGLRYEQLDVEQVATFADLGVLDDRAEGDWSEVSPKLTIDWKLRDDLMIYGTVAKGYRAGGLNIDFAGALGLPPELLVPVAPYQDTFDPDLVWNYEVGMKSGWLDGRLTWNWALFYIDWQDYQSEGDLFLGANGVGYTINSGDGRSYGVETDLVFAPTDRWLLSFGASHVDPTLQSGAFEGNQLANAPENVLNASAEYRWPMGSWNGFAYGGYSFRDESYGDIVNGDDPDAQPVGLNRSDSYGIGNLRLGVENDHWRIQAFVENIGDEYGSSFTFQVGSGLPAFESISLIKPRTYGVNVSYRY